MSTLLLGMGNPILSDDAIGVRLATDFGRRLGAIPGVDVCEDCSVGGLDLLEVLSGHSRVIVLDSVKTAGGRPGAWYHFNARALRPTLHLTSIHDTNFATSLELGHRLGMRLPDPSDIHIFAVEVEDATTFSEQMTPALEAAYPDCAAAIFREVRPLVLAGGSSEECRS
jgi:hydrogenase maturation protease